MGLIINKQMELGLVGVMRGENVVYCLPEPDFVLRYLQCPTYVKDFFGNDVHLEYHRREQTNTSNFIFEVITSVMTSIISVEMSVFLRYISSQRKKFDLSKMVVSVT